MNTSTESVDVGFNNLIIIVASEYHYWNYTTASKNTQIELYATASSTVAILWTRYLKLAETVHVARGWNGQLLGSGGQRSRS